MGDALNDREKLLSDQKTFLHAIATPVSIAQGMVDIVLAELRNRPDENKVAIERLEKAVRAFEKLSTLIEKHRTVLDTGTGAGAGGPA